jgi:hypothetical protein
MRYTYPVGVLEEQRMRMFTVLFAVTLSGVGPAAAALLNFHQVVMGVVMVGYGLALDPGR